MPPRKQEKKLSSSTIRATPIRIREIVDANDPALKKAYKLLVTQFPREERVEKSDWVGTLAEMSGGLLTDIAWHLLVAEQGDEVVGLTSGTYLGNVNIGVIGYLAMEPQVRARGIGTRLRTRLRRLFERDAERIGGRSPEALVGEVAIDNRWLRTLASREGVLVLDFRYFQPSLYEGDAASQFVLYYESLGKPRRSIPVSELRRILYTVWRRTYRVSRPLDDPAFRAMLRSFGKRRNIGGVKLNTSRKR